jgi:hypothetical protein
MSKLAFMTFGILRETPGDPAVQGFLDRTMPIFYAASREHGFLGLAQGPMNEAEIDTMNDADYGAWGRFDMPRFYDGDMHPQRNRAMLTLTAWDSIEAVFRFSYTRLHAEALRHRHRWTTEHKFPNYVMWWVADSETPTWSQGRQRLEQLYDEGPSANAFNFQNAFDAMGNPVKIDPNIIKQQNQ